MFFTYYIEISIVPVNTLFGRNKGLEHQQIMEKQHYGVAIHGVSECQVSKNQHKKT